MVLIDALLMYVIAPRFLTYVLTVGLAALVVSRMRSFTFRSLVALVAVNIFDTVLISFVVSQIMLQAVLGWPRGMTYGVDTLGLLGGVGALALGVLLCAYRDPLVRADLNRMITPRPAAVDPMKAVVLGLLAVVALIAIVRALTGWTALGLMPTAEQARRMECTQRLADEGYTGKDLVDGIAFCVRTTDVS